MNWLLLVIAGLFEVGFATCLGKAKETYRSCFHLVAGRLPGLSVDQHVPIVQGHAGSFRWVRLMRFGRGSAQSARSSLASSFSRNQQMHGACSSSVR
jgi:hypothetical protein